MSETYQKTQLPFSMEVAAGVVAEHCYQDRKFHQGMLKDPLATTSQLISKGTERPIELKEKMPNCKIHVLKNDNKRWHIVLPFEYRNETPSLEDGILTEEDLEQIAGGVFGLAAVTGIGVGAIASVITYFSAPLGLSIAVPTVAFSAGAAAAAGVTGTAGTFLSAGAIAGITAGIVAGGVALAGGVSVAAIAGLDAAGIIDAF